MIDFKKAADHITNSDLWGKCLDDLTQKEVLALGEAFFSSPSTKIPPDGWKKPYINEHDDVVIPHNSHPDYHWWKTTGKPIKFTIDELVPEGQRESYYKRYLPKLGELKREVGDDN